MINKLKSFLNKFVTRLFKKKKSVKLGFYGPPNAGKTTLANRICQDWLGEDLGSVSKVPHETREIQVKEKVKIKSDNKELDFNIIDTPGIATKIDYEDFIKHKMAKTMARRSHRSNQMVRQCRLCCSSTRLNSKSLFTS